MAKKQTPGKGGAKGMHHGHAYKATCGCAICKSKKRKLATDVRIHPDTDGFNGVTLTDVVTNVDVPTFERKDTLHEYVAVITYNGITHDNCIGTFDPEKGEMLFTVEGKYTKVFDCPEHDVNESERRSIISTINENVLTVMIPRKQVPLTTDTVNQFPQGDPIPVNRNEQNPEQTAQTTVETKTDAQPKVEQKQDQKTEANDSTNLCGEITITDETYGVMKTQGVKLVKAFNLGNGFDHGKFINDLANRAIVFYCNNLK